MGFSPHGNMEHEGLGSCASISSTAESTAPPLKSAGSSDCHAERPLTDTNTEHCVSSKTDLQVAPSETEALQVLEGTPPENVHGATEPAIKNTNQVTGPQPVVESQSLSAKNTSSSDAPGIVAEVSETTGLVSNVQQPLDQVKDVD